MEDPKETDGCNVFTLYKLLATSEETAVMKANYEGGNYGYGHAKQALYELIIIKYATERAKFSELMEEKTLIEEELQKGALKARNIAQSVLKRVRTKVGY
jgi:tryptophanyl-tRNA synthetase